MCSGAKRVRHLSRDADYVNFAEDFRTIAVTVRGLENSVPCNSDPKSGLLRRSRPFLHFIDSILFQMFSYFHPALHMCSHVGSLFLWLLNLRHASALIYFTCRSRCCHHALPCSGPLLQSLLSNVSHLAYTPSPSNSIYTQVDSHRVCVVSLPGHLASCGLASALCVSTLPRPRYRNTATLSPCAALADPLLCHQIMGTDTKVNVRTCFIAISDLFLSGHFTLHLNCFPLPSSPAPQTAFQHSAPTHFYRKEHGVFAIHPTARRTRKRMPHHTTESEPCLTNMPPNSGLQYALPPYGVL